MASVGVTWVHSTLTTCSFTKCYKWVWNTNSTFCLRQQPWGLFNKGKFFCNCVCIYNNIEIYWKHHIKFINQWENQQLYGVSCWMYVPVCALGCEEKMRLLACMLLSLTTILTCLFLRELECMHLWMWVYVRVSMRPRVCGPAGQLSVTPLRLPAGGSQQSSISHCWVWTPVSVSRPTWLCLLLLPLLLSPSALADWAWQPSSSKSYPCSLS